MDLFFLIAAVACGVALCGALSAFSLEVALSAFNRGKALPNEQTTCMDKASEPVGQLCELASGAPDNVVLFPADARTRRAPRPY